MYCSCFIHLCSRPRWVPRQETWPNQPPGHRHTAPWCNCWGSASGRRDKLTGGPHLHQSGPGVHPPSQSSNPITPAWGRQGGGWVVVVPAGCWPRRKSPEPGAVVPPVAWQGLGAPGSSLLLPSQVEQQLFLFPLEGPEQAKRGLRLKPWEAEARAAASYRVAEHNHISP